MTEDVIRELQKEGEPSAKHQALLTLVKDYVRRSRSVISRNYDDWDLQDDVYRGLRVPDKKDREAAQKADPVKMIVPNTFAQVMTFTSFLFLMYNQNAKFFELVASGDEDYGTKKSDCETLLNQNMRWNKGNAVLFQHLLDIGRFGPGIIETCWTRKLTRAYVPGTPQIANVNGVDIVMGEGSGGWEDFVKYEGNIIRNVSPYRFFPDMDFPLTDFQKGKFCAAEEDYSIGALRELESVGEVAGIDHIGRLPQNLDKSRGGPTRSSVISDTTWQKFTTDNVLHNAIVTKCQVWIVPNEFEFGDRKKKLGPENFPVLYHIWYANDNRLIRVEPAYWWHNEFGWSVGQFTPDMHKTVNLGLADLIYRIQDLISWLLNSHVTSVRRNIQNRFLVNPMAVDTKTLDGEGDIYLRKGSALPLDRALTQLRVSDVTQGHINDIGVLDRLMEVVTGVNGNAMGQYASGRRSATESRSVTAGAAGRMKMHGQLIWESSLGPMGMQMLSNLRQELSEEAFTMGIGNGAFNPLTGQLDISERYRAFKGTPAEVICGQDYLMFDSTLQSEKGYMAQSLQDLLGIVLTNPQSAMMFDIDPKGLLEEVQRLRGSGEISRFSLAQRVQQKKTPPPQPQLVPEQSAAPAL